MNVSSYYSHMSGNEVALQLYCNTAAYVHANVTTHQQESGVMFPPSATIHRRECERFDRYQAFRP